MQSIKWSCFLWNDYNLDFLVLSSILILVLIILLDLVKSLCNGRCRTSLLKKWRTKQNMSIKERLKLKFAQADQDAPCTQTPSSCIWPIHLSHLCTCPSVSNCRAIYPGMQDQEGLQYRSRFFNLTSPKPTPITLSKTKRSLDSHQCISLPRFWNIGS